MSHYSDEREAERDRQSTFKAHMELDEAGIETAKLYDSMMYDLRNHKATLSTPSNTLWLEKDLDHGTLSNAGLVSKPKLVYKFREDELIAEFSKYIDKTYGGHYGQGGLQSSEVIVDRGHGIGFFLGNVDKYNGRYGKKGEPADHRKDIVKIIHYAFLALYEHDRLNSKK